MLIGNKDRFGIEFELDAAKLADPKLRDWLYGRTRWWCGGEGVGLYEADTTLRDVAVEVGRFLTNEGKRKDEALFAASAEKVVRSLVSALYEDHGQSNEQVDADDERYRRFLLKPQVDVFDAWDIFLIEGEKTARLIWRPVREGEVRECLLAPGEVDAIMRRFVDGLETMLRALR